LATFTFLFRARGGHAFHRLALRGGGDCGGAFSLGGGNLWVGKSSQRRRRVGRAFGGSRRDAAASAPRGPALVRRVVMTPGG